MRILIQDSTTEFIQADCTLREVFSDASQTTQFPIEDGSTISDHVLLLPALVTADLVITNQPASSPQGIGATAATNLTQQVVRLPRQGALGRQKDGNVLAPTEPVDRVARVYTRLRELHQTGARLSLITEIRNYTNMVLTRLDAPRTANVGGALIITCDFEQLLVASSQTVEVPETLLARHKPRQQDATSANEATAQQEIKALRQRSLAASALGL